MKYIIKILGITSSTLLCLNNSARAQIIPDGTTPTQPATCVSICEITGGTQAGVNLFHSFSQFNVDVGQQVTFIDSGVTNIITRVTGGNPSNIFGSLGVAGDANLFLINPKGIIFGSQATLNVNGSFVATIADAIEFGNRGIFSVSPTNNSETLTVNPSAFLFNQINTIPPEIKVQGSLQVNDTKDLVLLGGNLNIEQALLSASDGRIELAAVAGLGRIGLTEVDDRHLSLSFPGNVMRGDVTLQNGADVNVTGSGLGNIAITANNIDIYDSVIQAGAQINSTNQFQPGNIALNATAGVEIIRSFVINSTLFAAGDTGNILINAASLLVDEGSNLAASNYGIGDAGKVVIQVAGNVAINRFAGVYTDATQGDSGDIQIAANSLSLADGSLYTQAVEGSAGDVDLNINTGIFLRGENSIISTSVQSSSNTGGDINIRANSVALRDRATIYAVTVNEAGRAGDVTITAKDIVSLANSVIYNDTTGAGDAGNTRVSARGLDISNGGNISTSTNGAGNAGNIFVDTTEFVTLAGVNPDTQEFLRGIINTTSSGLFASTEENTSGRGGSIQVNTTNLSILDGAVMSARTRSATPGGNISVNAQNVAATGGGQILTSAFNQGRAGSITVNADHRVVISESDRTYNNRLQQAPERVDNDGAASGFLARVRGTEIADAGEIKVSAPSILLNNQGKISAETTQGEGGQISLRGKNIFLSNSQITATAGTESAGGNGGNIDINSDLFFAVRSRIAAEAFTGNGGNIQIATKGIFVSPNSQITASSQRGIDGVVEIITLDSEPSSGLVTLPNQPVDVSNLVAQGCDANGSNIATNNSEFVIAGRGGLPPTPNESLNTNSVLADLGTSTQPQAAFTPKYVADIPTNTNSSKPATLVEAQGWIIGANGEVILTAQVPTTTSNHIWSSPVACRSQSQEG